jgi:hypothetical protein
VEMKKKKMEKAQFVEPKWKRIYNGISVRYFIVVRFDPKKKMKIHVMEDNQRGILCC